VKPILEKPTPGPLAPERIQRIQPNPRGSSPAGAPLAATAVDSGGGGGARHAKVEGGRRRGGVALSLLGGVTAAISA
jgi:hypothetical protein